MAEMLIDNQPIATTFFGEGRFLTSFITPDALEVRELHNKLIENMSSRDDRILACWEWVANEVRYTPFVKGKLWINGHYSTQDDLWNEPSVTIRVKVGNCANKAFLLTSLLRNELSADEVYCVLGNLYQPKEGGHAWVEVKLSGQSYIMETTRADIKPFIPVGLTDIYEAVIYFNDKTVYAIEGRTVLSPFCSVYAEWLRDYLDWAYIRRRK